MRMRINPLPFLVAAAAAEKATCPCVNASELFATQRGASSGRPNCTLYTPIKGVSVDPICLPSDYGSSGCSAYDANVDQWCDDAAGWCGLDWCYVDHDTCRMSNLDMAGTQMFPKLDGQLYYSYGTCGSDAKPYNGKFANRDISLSVARGSVLEVSVPAMYPPAHYKTKSDGRACTYADTSHEAFESGLEQAGLSECDRLLYDDSVPWEGYVIEFLQALAADGQFSLRLRLASTCSRWTDSEWTAAVRDVQHGLADMGGGVFWVTPARSSMAAFSTELGADPMWLWVPRPSKDVRLLTLAFRMFEPFSGSLWLTIALVALAMSLVQAYVYQDEWREDAGRDEWRDAKGPLQTLSVILWQAGARFARSCLDFSLAGIEEYPRTAPKMIITIGWSFFILISISAYTANLAAYLTRQDAPSDYIGSMEQASVQRTRVCVADAIFDQVAALYPRNTLVRAFDLAAEARSGGCDAFLESMNAAELGERGVHLLVCELNHVAVALVLTVQQALPATGTIAPVLTNLIQTMRLELGRDLDTYTAPIKYGMCLAAGEAEAAVDSSSRRRLKAAAARSGAGGSGGGAGGTAFLLSKSEGPSATTPLTALEFLGPLLVWAFGGVLAVIFTAAKLYRTSGVEGLFGRAKWPTVDLSDKALEEAFRGIDTDNSGACSGTELVVYIKQVHNKRMGPGAIKSMMAEADTDEDGAVDLEEFKLIMRGGPKAAKAQMELMKEPKQQLLDAQTASESLSEHTKTSIILLELVSIKQMLQAQQAAEQPHELDASASPSPIPIEVTASFARHRSELARHWSEHEFPQVAPSLHATN